MIEVPGMFDDEASYPVHTVGSASVIHDTPVPDAVQRLHQVVREITGKDVAPPAKPRMGFLP